MSLHTMIHNLRHSQSGNVFFALFGAVALVGVVGASSMQIMKGPVRTMSEVTKRTVAENNMIASAKLALIAATSQADSGDCDADGFVEPIPFEAAGVGVPPGGGYLPAAIGAALNDPWDTRYGYCVWDHGAITAACGGGNFLAGENGATGYAIAIISAGPDRQFQTSCSAYPSVAALNKISGSDDIVLGYTYGEASALAGGLWTLKSGDADTAEIDRSLEVKDSGGNVTFALDAQSGLGDFIGLTTGSIAGRSGPLDITGGLKFESSGIALNGACTEDDAFAFDAATDMLVRCNGSVWVPSNGTDNLGNHEAEENIQLKGFWLSNDGGDEGLQVGDNGTVSSSSALNVGTDLHVAGASAVGATLTVTGATSLSTLGTSGLATLNSASVTQNAGIGGTLNVTGGTTLTSLTTTGAADLDSATIAKTLDVDGATTLSTLSASGLATLHSLSVTNNASVGGTLDMTAGKITNLLDPTLAQDAASKAYVDARVAAGTGFVETDPQVGTIQTGKWCIGNNDGSAIICDQNMPVPDDTLAGLSCSTGQVPAWNGTLWVCSEDAVGGNPSGIAGAVQFSGGSVFNSDASTFFWDNVNKRLGIGTSTPTAALQVAGNIVGGTFQAGNFVEVKKTNTQHIAFNGGAGTQWRIISTVNGTTNGNLVVQNTTDNFVNNFTNGLTLTSAGDVGMGASSPVSKLQVAGTVTATAFSGSGASLTNLNASNLSSGLVPTARLGTGTANATTYLRGDGTWAAAPSGADNLGNHTATQALAMGHYDITGVNQVIGGFGAVAVGGTLDWNHVSNARSGSGYSLLLGTATNGPGPNTYFYPFSFEYGTKDGSGQMTQFAIPYGETNHLNSGLFIRGRYSGTWTTWRKILTENVSGNVAVAGQVGASTFSGNGAALTNLNASNLATGTVGSARLGTGTANSTTYLRGDGTWAAVSGGDDLGNHTATQTVVLGTNWLNGDSGAEGLSVGTAGQVRIDQAGAGNTYDVWIQGGSGGSGTSRRLALLGTEAGMLYLNHGSEYASGVTIGGPIHISAGALTDNSILTADIAPLAVTNAEIANATIVATTKLSATGTKNSTTFLRGDNTWATIPSGADNLGNHTATQTLAMGAHAISSSNGTVIDANGGWHRSYGPTGWYNGTYGGGWYMTDSTYIRSYGSKQVLLDGNITAPAYLHSSDQRLKKDIATIVEPMRLIGQLRGVHYRWKADDKPAYGFIAQEVEKIMPDAVATNNEGIKAVEYDQMIGPLVEAVKAQQAEIDQLKSELHAIRGTLAEQ